jgi:predicted Zn finger-like uncharacterized protein
MVDDELEPLITRCPNCNTQFRVTENQLAVAGGRVRCGACLTVFQGIDHLILDDETAFATDSEADAALDALLSELEPGELSAVDDRDIDPGPLGPESEPVPGPERPRLYGGYEDAQATSEVEIVAADALEVEEAEAPASEWGEPIPDEVEASLSATENVPGTFDGKPAGDDMLAHADAASADDEPADEASADEASADETPVDETWDDESSVGPRSTADTEADYERWRARGTASIDQMVNDVISSAVPIAPSPGSMVTPSTAVPTATAPASEPSPEAAAAAARPEISFAPEPRRWWMAGLAVVFVLLLAAQIFYLQLPDWSRDPQLRPVYELACGWLGCELPEMRAVEALRTRSLVVRSHPDTSGALVVDATIVNTAPFEQRFPDLELKFTSVTGALVAGRRFSPDEYLPADFGNDRMMPPNTPIHVSLEIVDPGRDAVNYTLSFR